MISYILKRCRYIIVNDDIGHIVEVDDIGNFDETLVETEHISDT